MDQNFQYRELTLNEIPAAISLIWDVFLEFEANEYLKEGVLEFRNFLNESAIKTHIVEEYLHFTGCFDEERLIGVIAMRENKHISLLFVDKHYHKKGIARNLFEIEKQRCLKNYGNLQAITVNSSPYAVGFYHKLGFFDTGAEQTKNGIRFTPMQLNLR